MPDQSSQTATFYDVAIIGGGVVGCAVFRDMVLAGARTVLLERGSDLLSGASKGNSGLLHTGFDAPTGSRELASIRDGYRRFMAIRAEMGLPVQMTTAMVVAWTDEEARKLPAIAEQAHRNGVTDVRIVTAGAALDREPQLNPSLKGAVLVPGEAVIDPWSTPYAYALQALANGGTLWREADVTGGERQGEAWRLLTSRGELRAKCVINCAGNHGDLVEAIARPSPFRITPRKGQFVVYDKPAYDLFRAILLPVPAERTKGIVVSRTIYGNVLVGPTAEDQEERDLATTEEATLRQLIARGETILPPLKHGPVTTAYAGLRPATQFKDYQIEALPELAWITVAGIRSTGLSAALGIAQHVAGLYDEHFARHTPLATPAPINMPNLAEDLPRPYREPGRGEIVCHCEGVTRPEIEAALSGPLPARSMAGLKRRTRCMMGRCQSFYCLPRLTEIAAGRVAELPGETEPAQ